MSAAFAVACPASPSDPFGSRFFFFLPTSLLPSPQILVLTPSLSNLNRLLQATLVMVGLHKLHELLWTWSTGLPSPRRALQAWIFAAPYQGFALLRLALPARLGGYKQRTSDLDINQVVARPQRPTAWSRLGWFVLDPLVSTMFAFLAAFGVAIWRIVRDHERGTIDAHQTARASSASLPNLVAPAEPTADSSQLLLPRSHCAADDRLAHFAVVRVPDCLLRTLVCPVDERCFYSR